MVLGVAGVLRRAGMAGPSVLMPVDDVRRVKPFVGLFVSLSGVEACFVRPGLAGMTGAGAGVGMRGACIAVGAAAGACLATGALGLGVFWGTGAGRDGAVTSCTYQTVERVVGGT